MSVTIHLYVMHGCAHMIFRAISCFPRYLRCTKLTSYERPYLREDSMNKPCGQC